MDLKEIISYILSIGAIGFGFWSWRSSFKIQKRTNKNILKNTELITSTTDLLEVSAKIGIKAAHINRQIALQKIENRFTEEKKFIVVGSSLKGLKAFVPKLEQILRARSELGLENRFLLTHPCFSIFRERQENRMNGEIIAEIDEMAEFLHQCGVNEECIRFYLGTPTNFLIITSDLMLINPYPYQIEAYHCFCLEVERKKIINIKDRIKKNFPESSSTDLHKQYENLVNPKWYKDFMNEIKENPLYDYSFDIADDIYGQFYWHHYLLPWYSKFTIKFNDFNSLCKNKIKGCIESGNQGKCNISFEDNIQSK